MGLRRGLRHISQNVNLIWILFKQLFMVLKVLVWEAKGGFKTFRLWFSEVREKTKDLYRTNIDLGKYHYHCYRYKEALFRFFLVKLFVSKNPDRLSEVFYNIGRCYMKIKDKKDKALNYYEKSLDINTQSKKYINYYIGDINNEKNETPFSLRVDEMKFGDSVYEWDFLKEKGYDVCDSIVEFLKDEFGSALNAMNIIDVGCRLGYNGMILRQNELGHKIYGVEFDGSIKKYLSEIEYNEKNIYDKVYCSKSYYLDDLSDLKGKFECVLINDMLSYTGEDLSVLDKYTDLLLNGKGVIIFYHYDKISDDSLDLINESSHGLQGQEVMLYVIKKG